MSYEQSNVGSGMVPHRKGCRCDERQLERVMTKLRETKARLAESERCIDLARRFMRGEIVNDQGEAWDQCLRTLDGYGPADSASTGESESHG